MCVCDFSNNFRSIRKYFDGTGDRAVVLRFCWFMASRRKFGFCRGFRMQMMFDRPSSLGRLITFSKRRIYFLFFSFFQLSSPTRNSRCIKRYFILLHNNFFFNHSRPHHYYLRGKIRREKNVSEFKARTTRLIL